MAQTTIPSHDPDHDVADPSSSAPLPGIDPDLLRQYQEVAAARSRRISELVEIETYLTTRNRELRRSNARLEQSIAKLRSANDGLRNRAKQAEGRDARLSTRRLVRWATSLTRRSDALRSRLRRD